MLYAILKPTMKAALRLYFGRIVTGGREHIDNGAPTIILANHTGSFLDAVITACFVKRRIHFFTRGDVFRPGIVDKVLRSLGMLPVYRMRDGRDKLQLNDSSNDEALKILAGGGAVIIFAEGESNVAKVLKPLKKGPFRLAAMAAAALPQAPVLVPLGINYVAQTRPSNDAFLIAGPALSLAPADYTTEAGAARAATDTMRRAAAALSPLVWHVDDTGNIPVAEALLPLLKDAHPHYSFTQSCRLLQRLNSADAATIAALQADSTTVRAQPAAWALRAPGFMERLLLVAGLPVAVIGLLINGLPVAAAKRIADRRVLEPDFWAPVFLCCAVVATGLWYALILLSGSFAGRPLYTLLALVLSAGAGIFFLKIYRPLWRRAASGFHQTGNMPGEILRSFIKKGETGL